MWFLRQSTNSQRVPIGPAIDETDGITPLAALTIAAGDILLFKAGASALAAKNSGGATATAGGYYYCDLNATDSSAVGLLELVCHPTGSLPFRREFMVLEEAVYDALFAASATGYQIPIWSGAGATVNLSGTTIGTVTNGVTVTTNNDKTGYGLASTQTFSMTGNITGNLSGSVGSVTNRVTANTDQLAGQTVTAAAGVTFPTSVASPTNITAGTITTVTTLTNAPSDPAGVTTLLSRLTGTRAGYLDNLSAGAVALASGVTVTTNNDKTGYGLASTQTFSLTGNITGNLSGSVGSVTEKTGFKLASDGLDSIAVTAPTGVATTFPGMVVQTWRRFFKKATKTASAIKTYADNGSTEVTSQVISDDGTTETQGAAT